MKNRLKKPSHRKSSLSTASCILLSKNLTFMTILIIGCLGNIFSRAFSCFFFFFSLPLILQSVLRFHFMGFKVETKWLERKRDNTSAFFNTRIISPINLLLHINLCFYLVQLSFKHWALNLMPFEWA